MAFNPKSIPASASVAEVPSVAIIGGGFAGLCLAMQLKRAGIERFTIFEKGARLGGTWRDNRYPGAACDIPSMAYCFSFEQNVDWSRKWAPQREILAYVDRCAAKYELLRHTRLGVEIASARFDATAGVWHLESTTGERFAANVLVSAVGQLNRPSIPAIEGIERFAGRAFHSARWPDGEDLSGLRIGVVGNAASGVQLVPELAQKAKSLAVFQRSANWILPKNDRAYTSLDRALFHSRLPLARLERWSIWAANEARVPVIHKSRVLSVLATALAKVHLFRQVRDAGLRRALTPDYPIGAKRILISDDYFPALQRPNVALVTSPIARATAEGLVTRDGRAFPLDAIVYATGFHTTELLAPMRIEGAGGRTLASAWRGGAEAYLGISVSGFPNLFLMYGPNTNLGHNSILFMLECQTRYVLGCLRAMAKDNLRSIDVLPQVQAADSADVQAALARSVWATIDKSWYMNDRGRIVNNWPYSTARYYLRTRRVDLGRYLTVRADEAGPAVHPEAADPIATGIRAGAS